MNFVGKYKNVFLGIVLIGATIDSGALTLGRLHGAALLGRPLDVLIAVQQASDEDITGLCFEADVFYADVKIDASRVRVKLDAGSQAQMQSVRISSSVNVDEPVVTVYLRAGCSQKTSRRYVLLADLVSDLAPAPALAIPEPLAASVLPAPALRPSASAIAAKTGPAIQAPGSGAQRPSRRNGLGLESRSGSAKLASAMPAQAPAVFASKKTDLQKAGRQPQIPGSATGKSLLKLDPADLLVSGDIRLRLSSELGVTALGNEKLRADAIALWRAINANPQDVLRESSQRVEALEANVRTLRALTGKNQQTVDKLTLQVQQAESGRFDSRLVYALAALLALAMAAAAYFWSRQRGAFVSGGDWWHSSHPAKETVNQNPVVQDKVLRAEPPVTSAAKTVAEQAPVKEPPIGVDIVLDLNESRFSSFNQANERNRPARRNVEKGKVQATAPAALALEVGAALDSRDFPQSMGGALRAINAEVLLDIRQQAEFFLALGQYDQAIQILESRISEHGESSPLVYLDLLKIFHSLGREPQYLALRDDFNLRFKGQLTEFATFHAEGKALEDYPSALASISALWPSAHVMGLIEDCIFRNPGEGRDQSFDLAAFRELLMLHAIARQLDAENRGDAVSGHAPLTRSSKVCAEPVQGSLPSGAGHLPSGSTLDIDLDLMAQPEAAGDPDRGMSARAELPVSF